MSDLPEWGSQYISIEKRQSVQSLCLSGHSDIALDSEMVQKLCNLRLFEVTRVTLLVEQNESANPESIGFLCSHTEMATAAGRMNLIHVTQRGGNDIAA